jgi:hypothetical protein
MNPGLNAMNDFFEGTGIDFNKECGMVSRYKAFLAE